MREEVDVEGPPAAAAYRIGFVTLPVASLAFILSGIRDMQEDPRWIAVYVSVGVAFPVVTFLASVLGARPRKARHTALKAASPTVEVIDVIISGVRRELGADDVLRRAYSATLVADRRALTIWSGGKEPVVVQQWIPSDVEIRASVGKHAGTEVSVLELETVDGRFLLPVIEQGSLLNVSAGGRAVVSAARRLRAALKSAQ